MVRNSTPGEDAAHDQSGPINRPQGTASTGMQTLRPGSAIATGVIALVVGLSLLVPALLAPQRVWTMIAVIVLVLVLVWLFVVRPCVKVHDDGLRIVNPLRTVEITWPMITEVRSRWVLELVCGSEKYAAWGIPADPKRPRYGRGLFQLGAGRILATQQPEAQRPRPKVEAQTVALEIERLIAADRERTDGRTPRILRQAWDPASLGLLLAALAFTAITFLT